MMVLKLKLFLVVLKKNNSLIIINLKFEKFKNITHLSVNNYEEFNNNEVQARQSTKQE